jgi:hypothetical protein
MRRRLGFSALAALMLSASPVAAADPEPAKLIAANMRPFAFADGTLSGPGAAFLETATADSQFVLFGEDHYLHDTPIFAGALYRMLRARHGFRHLVVEQDRVAMEDALAPASRGDARKLGALASRYPNLFEFASDQDLELLALVGRLETGPEAICGIEQALGPVRYFDELAAAAPNAAVKAEIAALREQALKRDPERVYSVNFLSEAGMPERLARLRADFGARPGSRHDEMLFGLARSSEIFRYYFRAEAGEPVGLFNNTVREAWFKRLFMDCYRRAATGKALPRALFKFGANHMYHGKNPTQAFPIGNFAHEFAIANGMEAYGLFVLPLMDKGYAEVPEWIRVLLPATPPTEPVVIDLESLRPVQRVLRAGLKDSDQTAFRELVNGFEALVVLPGERPATMALSGLKGLR